MLVRIQNLAPTTLHVRKPPQSSASTPAGTPLADSALAPFWSDTEMPCSNTVEDFFLSQMLSSDPQIRAEAHVSFAVCWTLIAVLRRKN
ncbi:unnamed protein product [Dibothriocephalus latus]|uniref:Uncharacterized protein n=1 Tax=Dibothriocephalus latus TaxID=60516 RepID=A0A3P6QAQ8_DIBLA|nr:unnamed protein product [Dibothriocephalus latus]